MSQGADMNLGVRFVDQNDIKFNSEVSKFIDVEKIGSKGYLVASTEDPEKFSRGFHKVVPGLEEVRGYLKMFEQTSPMPTTKK